MEHHEAQNKSRIYIRVPTQDSHKTFSKSMESSFTAQSTELEMMASIRSSMAMKFGAGKETELGHDFSEI